MGTPWDEWREQQLSYLRGMLDKPASSENWLSDVGMTPHELDEFKRVIGGMMDGWTAEQFERAYRGE